MTVEKRMNGTRRLNGTVGVRVRRQDTGRTREPLAQRSPAMSCRPISSVLEARTAASEPAPIWFAALAATRCQATGNGEDRSVRFEYVAGRALYTNASKHTENIDPLGVSLLGGQTLAVYWVPGETAYTMEVYRQGQRACA